MNPIDQCLLNPSKRKTARVSEVLNRSVSSKPPGSWIWRSKMWQAFKSSIFDLRRVFVQGQSSARQNGLPFSPRHRTTYGSFENEDRSTKHPNLENEAPKSRKRSTQNSKTKHPKLENGAPKSRKRSTQNSKPVCPLKTRDSPLSSHQRHATSLCTMLRFNFLSPWATLCGWRRAYPMLWCYLSLKPACHRPIFNLFHDILFLSEKNRFRPVGDVSAVILVVYLFVKVPFAEN